MDHPAPRTVRTARLIGTAADDADAPYAVTVGADERVQRWLFGKLDDEAAARARLQRWKKMWQVDGLGFWIFRDASGAAVGHGGLFRSVKEHREVELGYALLPEWWGAGLATEMAAEALRVGAEVVRLRRIIAVAQVENVASRRVLEKIGMRYETDVPSPDGIPGARYAFEQPPVARDGAP